jgi:hypothetical protein
VDQYALQALAYPALHHHRVVAHFHHPASFSGLHTLDATYENHCLTNVHGLNDFVWFVWVTVPVRAKSTLLIGRHWPVLWRLGFRDLPG